MNRNIRGGLALCAMLACAGAAAKEVKTPIYNIYQTSKMDCSGSLSMDAFEQYPRRAEVLKTGRLVMDGTGYQVDFNAIPAMREQIAFVNLHAKDRGVDDSYVLFSRNGYGGYDAAYVVTRLPDDMKNLAEDQLLAFVANQQRKQAGGNAISFIRAQTPFGPGMEAVSGGRVGSMCFPTSKYRFAQSREEASVGISRFAVRNGDLIEMSLVMPVSPDLPQAEMISRAQTAMDAFQRGLTSQPGK